jgi:hypothetical protein
MSTHGVGNGTAHDRRLLQPPSHRQAAWQLAVDDTEDPNDVGGAVDRRSNASLMDMKRWAYNSKDQTAVQRRCAAGAGEPWPAPVGRGNAGEAGMR